MLTILADVAAKAAPAAAQSAEAAPQTQTGGMGMMVMMIAAFVIMFWVMSNSNKKQQRKREEMLNTITKGTQVLLSGGIYGTVSAVQDKILTVEIADRVFIKVEKAGVHTVIAPEEKKSEEPKAVETKEKDAAK